MAIPVLDADIKACANELVLPEPGPFRVINATTVKTRPVEWLWYPYIPRVYVTLASGEKGVGKFWVLCAITAGVTIGVLPLGERIEPQNVLIFFGRGRGLGRLSPAS